MKFNKWILIGIIFLVVAAVGCENIDATNESTDLAPAAAVETPTVPAAPAAPSVVAAVDSHPGHGCPHAAAVTEGCPHKGTGKCENYPYAEGDVGDGCPHKGAGKCENCPYADGDVDEGCPHKGTGKCEHCPYAKAGASKKCAHHAAENDGAAKPAECPHHRENATFQL
jgi:hypothetical protein